MQSSDTPSLFPVPFANSGVKNEIPTESSGLTGQASLESGFPPITMTPVSSGGIPPAGADFNGILNQISSGVRWSQAGGTYVYSAEFAASIGGYPRGSLLRSATENVLWLSSAENNMSDPDSLSASGWINVMDSEAIQQAVEESNANAQRAEEAADIAVQYSNAIPYATRALMEADTSKPDNTKAWVWGDAGANNGLYVYSSSTSIWSRAEESAQPANADDVEDARTVGLGARYIIHGALTYQYFDRGTASWVISHGPLTILRGAGRGQITVAAAENIQIAFNQMYYVDLEGVASGSTVTAQVTAGNADNSPLYGAGAFVEDLKLPLFTYRGSAPGGLLYGRTLDQANNWPAISPEWFKISTATRIIFDAETRTLSWNGTILCPVPFASTRRNVQLAAYSVVIPEGNYKVVWLDLRKIPGDTGTAVDPALAIQVGSHDETLSSASAYRGLRYQIPLFACGNGVARAAPGFFDGQIEGISFPADTSAIQSQVDSLAEQVDELAEDIANVGSASSPESRDPIYVRDGVIYRHDALGEQVLSDETPNLYSAPPYWRGRAVISTLDRPTLGLTTAVAIKADGMMIHPSAENLITILAGFGQSNGRGMRGNVGAAISLDPKYASTMQMFDGAANMDVRLGILAADFGAPIDPLALTGFQTLRSVDTTDNTGTTMLEGAAASIHRMLDEQLSLLANYVYFTAARGGTSLAGLVKGTVPYQNFMIAVQRAKDLAALIGKHVWLPAVLWIHGESDTSNTNYATQLIAFWTDLNTDVKAITGQEADVQMIMTQPSSFMSFQAPLQMLRAAELNSNFHVVCPGYPLPYYTGDYLHYDRVGHFKLGEYCWKALRNVVYGDRAWKPLQPESVSFNGTDQVEITFHVPVGELLLDGDATAKDGNWGFQLFNGSTQVAITDKVLAGNVVTLTAESSLTAGNSSVRYALVGQTDPRTAAGIPRGRLRDSDPTPSLVDGAPLHNWCVHFEETF